MAIDNHESYGFQQVNIGEKQSRVNHVFARVAENYDLMNDVMSGGMHRLWKNQFVTWLNMPRGLPWRHLDVAGGTGDISFRLLDKGNKQAHATILDISGEMLNFGRERAKTKPFQNQIDWVEGNAESLPFEDNHFDSYSIAFGIRNVPDIEKAIQEAFRVLKPGGRFMCLEFSHVDVPVLDKIYDFYSFEMIPKFGKLFAGDDEPYQYLVESIRKFPSRDDFADLIKSCGFEQVKVRPLTGGVAAIHSGWKL